MGAQKQHGFTIIEVLLFIAISGGLLAALLVGVNGSIEQQRYRDSVTSLASFMQSQYDKALNTSNSRSSSLNCDAAGIVSAAGTQPGTTDCLIIGRLITGDQNGVSLRSTDIIAYVVDSNAFEEKSDVDSLRTSGVVKLMLAGGADASLWDEYTPEWGAKSMPLDATGAAFGSGGKFAMAIIRSPKNGSMMTFVGNGASENIQDELISAEGLKNPLTLCVEPDGFAAPQKRAIVIAPNTISPAGVSTKAGVAGC